MIRHIVLLRFTADVVSSTKAELMAELEALSGHLSGIVGFKSGANISPETPVIHGFEDGFWFDFESIEARNAYLADPEHQKIGAKLVARTEGGPKGVIVFDIEI